MVVDFSSLTYVPVEGKTYSLFGRNSSTSVYYALIEDLANRVLRINPDLTDVIEILRRFSYRKKYLADLSKRRIQGNFLSDCINLLNENLSQFTQKTNEHLKQISMADYLLDRRLGTTREQYHLYMLEIELSNRQNTQDFIKADRKIALMPHCLRDFAVECKSEINGIDYQCRHCSGVCFQNYASRILKQHVIEPYIWRGASIKRFARDSMKVLKKPAVFGIACIPELVWGMRKCRRYGIPVLGLPLNANRCMRWFGEFFPNSVDLLQLRKLVSGN